MSGTSLDGVDASIIKSDGEDSLEIIDNIYESYPDEFKKRLYTFIENINNKEDIKRHINTYKSLERELTIYHIKVSQKIINKKNIKIQFGFMGKRNTQPTNELEEDANFLSQALRQKVVIILGQMTLKMVEELF